MARRHEALSPCTLPAANSCGRHLTPPSSGRSKGRFSPFAPPLMSNVRPHTMINILSLTLIAAVFISGTSAVKAAPLNKCVINGTVTYQQAPCPSTQARKDPSLEELNAAEKKRRAAAASAAIGTQGVSTKSTTRPGGFSCDGRQYCSQMRSCDESKYFLANCPGVKMDGDKNGIPCEKQWCSR